jgi:hypothetical protein
VNNTCIGDFSGISEGHASGVVPARSGYNHFYTPSGNISVNGNMTLAEAQAAGLETGSTAATLASLQNGEVLQMVRELLGF